MAQIKHLRWYIVGLLMLATTINYIDRNAMSVAIIPLQKQFGLTNQDFAFITTCFIIAYGIMHPVMGRLIDWIGTRAGFGLAVVWWSVSCVLHAFAGGRYTFAGARFLLGMGEAGNFPAAIKTVGEWFPSRERAVATSIFNMGAGFGAILAPIVVVWLIKTWGWQSAFIFTGSLGFIWLVLWLLIYQSPDKSRMLSAEERDYIQMGQEAPAGGAEESGRGVWRDILVRREAWGLMFARFLADPVWWFYMAWLPKYLSEGRGFTLSQIAMFAWMPFLSSDFGSLFGGALSSFFIRRGMSILGARKLALCICACFMPAALLVVHAESAYWAIFFICLATFGHQAWSANLLTLPTDLFPKTQVGTAYGLTGATSAVGSSIFQMVVGLTVTALGYGPVFAIAGVLHPLAAIVVLLFIKAKRAAPSAIRSASSSAESTAA